MEVNMTRSELCKVLSNGITEIKVGGVVHHATIEKSILPSLPNNETMIRMNFKSKTSHQIAFFDMDSNRWVIAEISEVTL